MSSSHAEDLALAKACLEYDQHAWEQLVRTYETTVYYAILNTFRVHHTDPHNELVVELQSEVFYRLVRDEFAKLRHFSGRSSLKHWLKVVTGNFVIDYLRKKKPACSFDDPTFALQGAAIRDHAPSPEENVSRQQAKDLVRALCTELSASDQEFVELFFRQELSSEEVAEKMGTTVGAIYSRKNRIRKKLEELVRKREKLATRRRSRV